MKHLQRFIVVVVMALTAIASAPLYGQGVGERLRVKTAEGGTMIGTVSSMSEDGFRLNLADGGSRSVALSDIQKLERSLGTRTHKKRGFLIGVGVGVLSAIGGMPEECADPSCNEGLAPVGRAMETGEAIAAVPVFGLTGLVVGHFIKTERWETIPATSMSGRWQLRPMLNVASIGGDRRVLLGSRIHF